MNYNFLPITRSSPILVRGPSSLQTYLHSCRKLSLSFLFSASKWLQHLRRLMRTSLPRMEALVMTKARLAHRERWNSIRYAVLYGVCQGACTLLLRVYCPLVWFFVEKFIIDRSSLSAACDSGSDAAAARYAKPNVLLVHILRYLWGGFSSTSRSCGCGSCE